MWCKDEASSAVTAHLPQQPNINLNNSRSGNVSQSPPFPLFAVDSHSQFCRNEKFLSLKLPQMWWRLKSLSVFCSGTFRRHRAWRTRLRQLLRSFRLHAALHVFGRMRGNLWILFEKQTFGKMAPHPPPSSHFILSEWTVESSRCLSCEVRHQLHLQTYVQNAGPCTLIRIFVFEKDGLRSVEI